MNLVCSLRASNIQAGSEFSRSLNSLQVRVYEILNFSILGTLIHECRIHGIRTRERLFIRGILTAWLCTLFNTRLFGT